VDSLESAHVAAYDKPSSDALGQVAKWSLSARERQLVERYLSKAAVVLEYGAGATTLAFATAVAAYKSVELSADVCAAVQQRADEKHIDSLALRCVPENLPRREQFHSPYAAYRCVCVCVCGWVGDSVCTCA